jgi:hypothetical protein
VTLRKTYQKISFHEGWGERADPFEEVAANLEGKDRCGRAGSGAALGTREIAEKVISCP